MSNTNPFFSIIIPTYNHGHLIKRCLDSVIYQSFQNWEVIVVNNFSQDNTIEVVESYNDCRIRLINNANKGLISVSRNKGISEASGEWICFLDSDDWWKSNKLKECLNWVDNYDFVYHDLEIRKTNSNVFNRNKVISRKLSKDALKDLLINGNAIATSSVAIKKTVVDSIGLFTEEIQLVAVEDFDYWIRAAIYGINFLYIPESLGYYWIGENISSSIKQIEKEENIFCKYKYYLDSDEIKKGNILIQYNKARIYHRNSYFKEALVIYSKVVFENNGIEMIFKSIIGMVMCYLKIKS